MEPKPVMYDAAGTYAKEQRSQSGPRNVPANLMSQVRGAAIHQIIGNPMAQAAATPGFSGEVARWNTLTNEQKMEAILDIGSVEQLCSTMILEQNNDILRAMIDRKEDLEKLLAVK